MEFNSFKPVAPTNMMKVLNRIATAEANMVSCQNCELLHSTGTKRFQAFISEICYSYLFLLIA